MAVITISMLLIPVESQGQRAKNTNTTGGSSYQQWRHCCRKKTDQSTELWFPGSEVALPCKLSSLKCLTKVSCGPRSSFKPGLVSFVKFYCTHRGDKMQSNPRTSTTWMWSITCRAHSAKHSKAVVSVPNFHLFGSRQLFQSAWWVWLAASMSCN